MQTHLKIGSVKCEICKQGVVNVFNLRKHIGELDQLCQMYKFTNSKQIINRDMYGSCHLVQRSMQTHVKIAQLKDGCQM